ncbi:hypothetical protein PHK61_31585 [Actinomycetospora lutea]|uniref:hypothetical protein n=1 Tax=Actinomycetospora lutea TaxID=663604 RepID=UPI00236619DD|nr:hypothetical protein [Actinomycetospora lutea]MDD7942958.1 hypothetical protein [Actinomycetospora lutea]
MTSSVGPDGADPDRCEHRVRAPVQVITEWLKERVYAQLSVVAVRIGLALAESDSAVAAASAVAATAIGHQSSRR